MADPLVEFERVHIELPDSCRSVAVLHPAVPLPVDAVPRCRITCCREGCSRDCWLGDLDLGDVRDGKVVPMCVLCAARLVPVGVELAPGDRIELAKPIVRTAVARARRGRR